MDYSVADIWFGQGADEIKWPDEVPTKIKQCTLTNYGSVPLFEVSMEFSIAWRESEHTENGMKAGRSCAREPPLVPNWI